MMMVEHVEDPVEQHHAHEEVGEGVVRIDALRSFNEVVLALGGDPDALLQRAHIDRAVLNNRNAVISYRAMVRLLERAANELACPDFGLRLAGAQGGARVLCPLEVAMRNSPTLADALRYCADHMQVYSPAAQISLEPERGTMRTFARFEILLAHLPSQRQADEHAMLLTQRAASSISGGRACACEIWFTHERLMPISVYRKYFNATVRFGQLATGLFFYNHDLGRPTTDPDPQLYELATSFIDTRFPSVTMTIATRVRWIIAKLLVVGQCTNNRVASILGLHPRTLQRRLREEGTCVEAIKDSVRSEIAARYLRQPDVPLVRVAEMLGYAEASVLSRSCHRWFSASPRQLRRRLMQTT
jgi:AraC-like DNA-binding protein